MKRKWVYFFLQVSGQSLKKARAGSKTEAMAEHCFLAYSSWLAQSAFLIFYATEYVCMWGHKCLSTYMEVRDNLWVSLLSFLMWILGIRSVTGQVLLSAQPLISQDHQMGWQHCKWAGPSHINHQSRKHSIDLTTGQCGRDIFSAGFSPARQLYLVSKWEKKQNRTLLFLVTSTISAPHQATDKCLKLQLQQTRHLFSASTSSLTDIITHTNTRFLRKWRGWTDSSGVENIYCSCRGPEFNSQNPHDSSQLPTTSVSGDPMSSPSLHRLQHTWCT